ncbi:bifunctional diaminohydroxyphosphoribosylaminopyrimidine deaminase/5-amino-6-(5-phosphoribosylamino)uracil reductase RibD [Corynebacterium sp.]|uniref:bifunctional diaminohydroxyphosphoribosylaminopyrimidine deaminase/5-amino-6-(5-phosphoribosylamino)uracil reductase RibD n=1 Tax=Corynebacterium sp. TaxID=1720 RepID=UPI0026DD415A|nr:bifunctional diaminohydroxyphosphoribosylaminopyrimidine deaminase/5-amino-6-(5-phosphoribosylamino)uracil reductase RibD [Corynebacterium sp.]MDO5031526.1 bifunctional diaminohydroxyphosphoribosylaminopyrimidine deaminase/5-amino-6-(5-phosphoribosylamino)uracil reductase RibD [Corynebacterium sp.]
MPPRSRAVPDATILAALRSAMEAAQEVRGTTSPNPPVGAVILDSAGEVIGVGATQPPGGPHAEVMALRAAAESGRTLNGATAVVTLEPCNHTGRTGPCSQALIQAGIERVFYLHSDPNPNAAGGADTLRQAGVEVNKLSPEDAAGIPDALRPWLRAVERSRPHVTLKFAQSLDGFTAAPDGTSQWITGPEAREFVHEDRARRDAIIVGTGTALADNPSLTARYPDGSLREGQPRRVVIGTRDAAKHAGEESNLARLGYEHYASIEEALDKLYASGARDVLVEGGAGLATSFLEAGVVDWIQAYVGAVILGAGRGVLTRAVAPTLAGAPRLHREATRVLGEDVLIEYSL